MLAFFVWSEEPKPLVKASLFEFTRKQAKERISTIQSLNSNNKSTADRAPRTVTIIYKGIKSDKNALRIFRLVGRAETARKRAAF